jgi:hypothetical protein
MTKDQANVQGPMRRQPSEHRRVTSERDSKRQRRKLRDGKRDWVGRHVPVMA